MGPIPLQRDIAERPGDPAGRADARPVAHTSLPGNLLAPSAARRFLRAALGEWTGLGLPAAVGFSERVADDAEVVVSELVTNAVVHTGTNEEVLARLEEATGFALGFPGDFIAQTSSWVFGSALVDRTTAAAPSPDARLSRRVRGPPVRCGASSAGGGACA